MAAPFDSIDDHLRAIAEVAQRLLARAIASLTARERGDGNSRFRVGAAEVARLLSGVTTTAEARAELARRDAEVDAAWADLRARLDASAEAGAAMPLDRLGRALGLDALDLQVVVALAALDVDPDLERAYAVAWDDFTKKRPDPSFLAFLLGGDALDARGRVLAAFEPDAPLRRHRVIALGTPDAALALRPARLADRVVAHLRGRAPMDEAIAPYCKLAAPVALADLVIAPAVIAQVRRALVPPMARVLLAGPDGVGKASLCSALLGESHRPALRVDLSALWGEPDKTIDWLAACAREAALRGALLLLEAGPELVDARLPPTVQHRIGAAIASMPAPVVVTATERPPWLLPQVPDLVEIDVPGPTYAERVELWRRALPADAAVGEAIDIVAGRYSFGGAAIARAARRATSAAWLRDPSAPTISLDDVADAARLMFSHRLGSVAQRIPTGFTWADLVLPEETLEQLLEVVKFARLRPFLLETWGFARKLPYGRGVSAILAGPPGTGKTMVAQLLARELGYDLYRIDLSQVVNKYIGETEKNLARIFEEAEDSHAVLFFDEADALFGKRTDVKSSTDRYANLEVNYLLQRMETYDGVTLLATNLEQGIDEAFKRRVRFTVQFEVPDAEARERLWRSMFPPEAPLADDIDWRALADKFEMAGGYIKKAALRAALIAADATPHRPIRNDDLMRAARQEYREMGRVMRD